MVKKILITPLDWGLGHATRCIPIIRELRRQGCAVLIAGSGDSLTLLRNEFPTLDFFSLPGYNPRYPLKGSMVWTMAMQLPRFMRVIRDEHRAVERIIIQENVHLLISDNRYGCWSEKIPSAFITHQSNILMPRRFGWLQYPVRRLSDHLIRNFDFCWIPDFPGEESLAGKLAGAANGEWGDTVEYLGALSRFERRDPQPKAYDLVAVLSGPEPQRTAFEETMMRQLKGSGLRYLIVRGLPGEPDKSADSHTVNFLGSDALQTCMETADVVIARSGFSTVMDMAALGKKVVFVPTPGQTEQEYLAKRLMDQGVAYFMEQDSFDLEEALRQSTSYAGFAPRDKGVLLQNTIARFLGETRR